MPVMFRAAVLIVMFVCLSPLAYPQAIPIPSRLDDLIPRAEEFRRLLAAGNRAKASEFVLPADRDRFLNDPVASLQNPQMTGVDFVDKDTVRIRTTGKAAIAPAGGSPQISETRVADTWVRSQNRWYFQPSLAEESLLAGFGGNPSADAQSLAEIRSNFKVLADVINVGRILQGEVKFVSIPIEYTGVSPIRLAPKLETPLATLDMQSSSRIIPGTKEFGVWVSGSDLDGPFNTMITFTVYYQGVAMDHSVKFEGNVFAPFTFRQLPEAVPPDSYVNFQLFVRNNNDVEVKVSTVAADEYFFVDEFPARLGPGEEG